MKLFDIHRTANIAWSPVNHATAMLAAGTSNAQIDVNFDTAASLDIFEINPNGLRGEAQLRGSVECEQRIHKLVWSPHSTANQATTHAGILIAGIENGIAIYSADAVLKRDKESAVVKKILTHTGAVHALDVSPLLPNLFISGASESECFVWDLNVLNDGIPAGPKSFPIDDVNAVSWNKKINYIFASAYSSRCVLWDLRNASSAVKTLEGHQRGILSVSWCPHDPEILLSTGKDGAIYCWDVSETNKGEIIYALPQTKQWAFEVSWSPRVPSVFATSSTTIGIYSANGGVDTDDAFVDSSSKLAESFPGMDLSSLSASSKQGTGRVQHIQKAPKWLKKPGAFSFSFDGKLVKSFSDGELNVLELSHVSSNKKIVDQSLVLEQYLVQNQGLAFCAEKIRCATSHQEREEWKFIQALYDQNHAQAVLELIGYGKEKHMNDSAVLNGDKNSSETKSTLAPKRSIGSSFRIPTGQDFEGNVARALISGNLEKAVNLCLNDGREAEAVMLSILKSTSFLPDLFWTTVEKYFSSHGSDLSSLIFAILKRDTQFLLEKARIDSWKEVIAVLLNYFPREEFQTLGQNLGERLETELGGLMMNNSILCYLSAGNIDKAVSVWLKSVKPKAPIPAEHLPISDGFTELLEQTRQKANAAHDGHTVRKLDDVHKKLELLNDSLRQGSLSSATLMGLHQIVQCCQMNDFGQASAVQAHMSATGSFVEIGSFMPALKALLQLAPRFVS